MIEARPVRFPTGRHSTVMTLGCSIAAVADRIGFDFYIAADGLGETHEIGVELASGTEVLLIWRPDKPSLGTEIIVDESANVLTTALDVIAELAISEEDVDWIPPRILWSIEERSRRG